MKTYRLSISMECEIEPRLFFADQDVDDHKDTTEVDCAREVANFIHRNGMRTFLSDWNVDDFDISVGKYPAVRKGKPVVGMAVASNQESEQESQ